MNETVAPNEKINASPQVTATIYEREIPCFVANEIEKLYKNIHASVGYLKLNTRFKNVNTYVARTGDVILTIFLFEFERGKIDVLNQFIKVDQQEIDRFVQFVFAHFPDASVVTFPTIDATISSLSRPYRQVTLTDDFVIALPESVQQYEASLGKSTRRNTKACLNKLNRKFNAVSFEFYLNDQIDESHIRYIAELHRARLASQNVPCDASVAECRLQLSRECDTMVGLVVIDGRICAGSISYRVGENFFASMLAHDPDYNDDRVGFLCAYRTVCEGIARGGKEFHFGQARFRYKDNLLCVRRDMSRLEIYRSNTQLLLNFRRVAKMALKGKFQQLELWSKDPKRQHGAMPRFTANSMIFLKRCYHRANSIGSKKTQYL